MYTERDCASKQVCIKGIIELKNDIYFYLFEFGNILSLNFVGT